MAGAQKVKLSKTAWTDLGPCPMFIQPFNMAQPLMITLSKTLPDPSFMDVFLCKQ